MRAVFADCHVGRRPDDDGPFLEALERVAERGAREVSLLGDIFHFFIGDPKFETPSIARFLERVGDLRKKGVEVTYIEGNREFFLRGSYAEDRFREICDEQVFAQGGRRFLLTHGDLLNEKDLPYRFWRFLAKNPVARASIPLIPRKVGNRFVWRVEARLYRANFKHKRRLPVEMIREFARRKFAEGVDVVLLGHFHKPWAEQIGHGRVEILPAFVDERRWMEIADDGSTALVGLDG